MTEFLDIDLNKPDLLNDMPLVIHLDYDNTQGKNEKLENIENKKEDDKSTLIGVYPNKCQYINQNIYNYEIPIELNEGEYLREVPQSQKITKHSSNFNKRKNRKSC